MIYGEGEKKDISAYGDQFPVAFLHNIANHFLLWDKFISEHCICDILSEKSKWENLANANVKKVMGATEGKLEDGLAV